MCADSSFPDPCAGLELRKLSLEDRIAFLRGDVDAEGPVISRAEPRDKQDIVRLLKDDGEVGFVLCLNRIFVPKMNLYKIQENRSSSPQQGVTNSSDTTRGRSWR